MVVPSVMTVTAIFLSFSRSAWLAAAVIVLTTLFIGGTLATARVKRWGIAIVALFFAASLFFLPQIFLRFASSKGHIERPLEAIQTMVAHPFGLGLGTAGPASNRTSDACVMLEAGADASWAIPHKNLCVFVADIQVQPTDRACHCPLLTENWYLQIGVELGWIGFALFIALTILILKKLSSQYSSIPVFQYSTFLSFLAISIASLFLHAWEDSAVAWTVWVLVAAALTTRKTTPHY